MMQLQEHTYTIQKLIEKRQGIHLLQDKRSHNHLEATEKVKNPATDMTIDQGQGQHSRMDTMTIEDKITGHQLDQETGDLTPPGQTTSPGTGQTAQGNMAINQEITEAQEETGDTVMDDSTKIKETDLPVHTEEITDLSTGQTIGHQGTAMIITRGAAITDQDQLQETTMAVAEMTEDPTIEMAATETTDQHITEIAAETMTEGMTEGITAEMAAEQMTGEMQTEETPELPTGIQSSCQESMQPETINHGLTNTVRNVFQEETIMNTYAQPTLGSAPPSVANVAEAITSQQIASQAKEPGATLQLGHRPGAR